MYCLKCGSETQDEQAFCLACQKEMAKYPVDRNAVVQLPPRKQAAAKKPVKRRLTPDEQIRSLKKRVRIYACLFFVSLVAVACLSIPAIRYFQRNRFQIGQNYSTVKPTTPPTEVQSVSE